MDTSTELHQIKTINEAMTWVLLLPRVHNIEESV